MKNKVTHKIQPNTTLVTMPSELNRLTAKVISRSKNWAIVFCEGKVFHSKISNNYGNECLFIQIYGTKPLFYANSAF